MSTSTPPDTTDEIDTTDIEQIESALMYALRQAGYWAERAERLSVVYVQATGAGQ